MQLRIAMDELYANIVNYAYSSGDGWVEIRGGVEDGVATLKLIDAGTPFDPLAKPDPDVTLPGEEREIGGLGIYLVKNMVDEVEYAYSDGCNQLTLRKRLKDPKRTATCVFESCCSWSGRGAVFPLVATAERFLPRNPRAVL